MPKVTPDLFKVLNDQKAEVVLTRLYKAALKQGWTMVFHFLPKAFQFFGRGIDWKTENVAFYDDKYVPIIPSQGTFLLMQAMAINAKSILELGTSYGISTIYLGLAARNNGGKVITTEYLSHKAKAAKKNFEDAGLSAHVEVWEGDALETLKNLDKDIDLVLLDGWPDLVYRVFKLIEPRLKKGAVIVVDDVAGFQPSMQDYLDYVRNPANGYASMTLRPGKEIEFTVKIK